LCKRPSTAHAETGRTPPAEVALQVKGLTAEERARGGLSRAARIRDRKAAAERLATERLADSVGRACDVLAAKLDSDDERVQLRAVREILDSVLGRPGQAVERTVEGDEPVQIIVQSAFARDAESLSGVAEVLAHAGVLTASIDSQTSDGTS